MAPRWPAIPGFGPGNTPQTPQRHPPRIENAYRAIENMERTCRVHGLGLVSSMAARNKHCAADSPSTLQLRLTSSTHRRRTEALRERRGTLSTLDSTREQGQGARGWPNKTQGGKGVDTETLHEQVLRPKQVPRPKHAPGRPTARTRQCPARVAAAGRLHKGAWAWHVYFTWHLRGAWLLWQGLTAARGPGRRTSSRAAWLRHYKKQELAVQAARVGSTNVKQLESWLASLGTQPRRQGHVQHQQSSGLYRPSSQAGTRHTQQTDSPQSRGRARTGISTCV